MGKKTTRTARFLFYTEVQPVLLLFSRPRELKAKCRPKKLPANDLAKQGAAKASVKVFLPLPLIFIFLSLPLPYVNGPCKFCTDECPLHCGLWRDDRWWKQLCSRAGAHRQEASPLGI